MRRCLLTLILLSGSPASALDVCALYTPIHDKDILPRIRSGIPFKLLSLAADESNTTKKVVRVEFDLWSENLTLEVIGGEKRSTTLALAPQALCESISLPDIQGKSIRYRLMLNPALGESLQKLKPKSEGKSGFLEIDWERLAKDLDSEKTLIESEISE